MSVNYYLVINYCKECGRADRKHIGKLTNGCSFTFREYEGIKSYKDWLTKFDETNNCQIVDEYDKTIPTFKFKELIKNSQAKTNYFFEEDTFKDSEGFVFLANEFS